MAELCIETLSLSVHFPDVASIKNKGDPRSEMRNQWRRYDTLVRSLISRSYQSEVMDHASAVLMANLKEMLVRLVAEENELAQKDVKVNELLSKLRSTYNNHYKVTKYL